MKVCGNKTMIPYRKGLVAPQNTFLETIIRSSSTQHNHFLLANARVADFPIIFASDGFCQLTGFSKAELLHQGAICRFMHGDLTDPDPVKRLSDAFDQQTQHQIEVLLYRKNKTPLWLLQRITPIKDEKETVVMFLVSVRNITALKQNSEEESTKVSLSKFARLACRTMTRYRNTNGQQLSSPSSLSIEMLKNTSTVSPMVSLSDDVIPRYRPEAPKTPGHIILHYSGFKSVWDWLILVLTFYTAVMVPFNAAFQGKTMDNVPILVIDSVVDVVFFVDIFLNFHTTFVGGGGEVISDPVTIRKNYLRTWFIVDLLSCLPYDVFNAFPDSTENVSSLFSALKVVRLLRLGRVARKLDHYMEYGAAVLVLLIVMFVLIAHWFACLWFTIGDAEATKGVQYGWLQRLGKEVGMTHRARNNSKGIGKIWEGGPQDSMAYATALYFTLSCMTSVGFGNVSAYSEYEKIFTICMMILGSLLYATIFGNVTTIFQQMYSTTGRYHEMLNSIREFMKIHSVPKSLSERVVDYVVSTWSSTKGIDTDKVLNYCPADLKADICVHLNRSVFTEHPSFRLASDGCLRALAVHFTLGHWAPGNMVFHQGESVDVLCFVVSGSLEVIQDDEIVAILSKGDVIGDQFWKESTVGQCAANVRALTYCDLHVIRREPLLEVLRFYKPFAASFARTLRLTHNLRRRLVFRKVIDLMREKELAERNKNEPPIEFSDDHPVRKLISRFRKLSYTATAINSTPTVEDSQDELSRDQESDNEHKKRTEAGSSSSTLTDVTKQEHAGKPSSLSQPSVSSKWNALISLNESRRSAPAGGGTNRETEKEESGSAAGRVAAFATRRKGTVHPPYSENKAFENNEEPKELESANESLDSSKKSETRGHSNLKIPEKTSGQPSNQSKSELTHNKSVDPTQDILRRHKLQRTYEEVPRPTCDPCEKIHQAAENVVDLEDEEPVRRDTSNENSESDAAQHRGHKSADHNIERISSKLLHRFDDVDSDETNLCKKLVKQHSGMDHDLYSKPENEEYGQHRQNDTATVASTQSRNRKMLKFLNNIKSNLHLEIEELHHRMDNIDQHLNMLTAMFRPEVAAEDVAIQSTISPMSPVDYQDQRLSRSCNMITELSSYSVSTDILSCASVVTSTTEIAGDLAIDDC